MFKNTMNNATVNNNTKEEKKMTRKERWMANIHKGQDIGYKAARHTGYGIGYATETVKEEACYYGKKVKDAVASTKMAQNFTDGYYEGKNNAMTAFDCRKAEREYKAEQKKNAKAAKAAADELMNEFEDALYDALCGDGE